MQISFLTVLSEPQTDKSPARATGCAANYVSFSNLFKLLQIWQIFLWAEPISWRQAHTEPIFAFASTHKMDTDIPLSELVPILSTAGAEMYVEYPWNIQVD